MNRNSRIRNKRKHVTQAAAVSLSAVLAAAPVMSTIPVYAADSGISKEDTVYVFADPAGNAKDTTVSSHLILDGATGTITDSSDLEGITNVKGDETFTDSNGSLVWNADGQDIYYQGTTSKAAPVSVHVTYLLDGKEIQPSELAGKSGKLTIRVQYENNSDVTVDVDGKSESIKTPFLMMTGLILPSETFSNVTVDNGRIVNSGSSNVVLGYGMPGLKDSLKLAEIEGRLDSDSSIQAEKTTSEKTDSTVDSNTSSDIDSDEDLDFDTTEIKQKMRDEIEDLKISDTFEITADVTDFELGSTYTFAMSDLFSDLDTTDFLSVDKINEAMDKIKDAGTKLVDGSGELYDGTGELKDGYGELDDGIKTLRDGVGELASGSGTLKDGVKQYIDGVNTLATGVTSYVDGAEQIAAGVKSLSDLQKGIDQIKSGLDTLNSNTSSSSDLIKGINALNSGMAQLQKAANSIDVDKISQLVKAGQGSLDAAGVNLADVIAKFDGLESTASQVQDLASQIEELQGGIQSLGQAQSDTFNATKAGAKQVAQAVGSSSDLKSQLKAGVKSQAPTIPTQSVSLEGIDLSGLSDEQVSAIQGKIAEANTKLSATADAANQAISGVADSAVDAAVSATAAATVDQLESNLTNSGADQINSAVSTMNTRLDALKKKAQGVSASLNNVINSSSYQALKSQLPELKQTLNGLISSDPIKQLGTLQSSVNQLANGTSSLKKAMDEQLVPGIQKLDKGAKELSTKSSTGISALQGGMNKLTANDSKLKSGAKQVKAAGSKLFDGADALVDGIEKLQTGSGKLSDGSDSVKEGIDALQDGAGELHDGLVKLDEQGIQKISDLVEGDLTDLFDRVKAVSSADAAYKNFSGVADGMDSSVKFVIETEAIERN